MPPLFFLQKRSQRECFYTNTTQNFIFRQFVCINSCIFAHIMNYELFIARRLFGSPTREGRISKPAVTIAQWGVAVGIMVMIVSVCIVVGFKHEVRDKIIGFGSHIQVSNYYESDEQGELPVTVRAEDLDELARVNGIVKVQTFVSKTGLIAAGEEFEGVVVKGIGSGYDTRFFASHIVEGTLPSFCDTAASNKIVISRTTANKLKTELGDKLNIYFMQGGIKARRMEVAAIYETHLHEMDEVITLTDIYTTRRLNGWTSDKATGIEISVAEYDKLYETRDNSITAVSSIANRNGERLFVQTIDERNPHLFAWLALLDSTVWIILVLVLGIAGFTMVSGLLILILEKTNLIGIMKAIGAKDLSIRKIFLFYAMFIIGRGMLWGNAIGLALCIIQQLTGIIGLDPSMYYMERIPIEFTWWLVPMNIGMFIISTAMLVLPSMLISRIAPTKAIRFE